MKKTLAFMIIVFFVPSLILAQAGRKQVIEGNQLYQEQKYDEANNKYRDALVSNPENPIIHFNIGNAQYQKKKYEEAMKDFEKSLSTDDVLKQSKAYYNMGNTFYRMGDLPKSILSYTEALRLNPTDEDAKYNLEFVRAKLKEQAEKQQQQNQKQQQQKQQQQQQQGQQKENEEQKRKEEQEKQQQQQEQQDQQKEEEEQQQQQQQAEPQKSEEMTKEEAERILNALKKDDKDLQKQQKAKKGAKVRVVKDW